MAHRSIGMPEVHPDANVVTIVRRTVAQHDLVFFVLDASRVLEIPGVLTTDGNAASDETRFFKGDGAIPHLDWQILRNPCCYSRDYKRRKSAEVLVPDVVPPNIIAHIGVYNEDAVDRFWRGVDEVLSPGSRGRFADDFVRPRPELYYDDYALSGPTLVYFD